MSVTDLGDKNALFRAAYNRLGKHFDLPSVRTQCTRLTSKVRTTEDSSYIKRVLTNLNDIKQRTYPLLLDNVYVRVTQQYHGGIVFGKVINKPHLPADAS